MRRQFGGFTLDPATHELRRGEELVHLSPKAIQLLVCLAEDRPKAISKKDLHERLWPETFVSETNLATLIAEIRSALGDDAQKPRFVRTVYAFGYAFCGEVTEDDGAAPRQEATVTEAVSIGDPAAAMHRLRRSSIAAGALGLIAFIVFGGAGALSYFNEKNRITYAPSPRGARSLAVLPFRSTPSKVDDHLGFGMSDLLITRLSSVKRLTIRPTSAIARYATTDRSSIEIGRELGVDVVLEGNIQRSGDRVRVTVQAVDVRTGEPIWADNFDERFTEMFVVEDSISQRVARALTTNLGADEVKRLAHTQTTDSEAYRLYMAARFYMFSRTREGHAKSVELLERAVAKYPDYALAYAGLADTLAGSAVLGDVDQQAAGVKARAAALKAIQLDPSLSEAHSALGIVLMFFDRDWPGADRELRIAHDLNPSDVWAQRWRAWYLQSLRRFDEAVLARNRAIDLDPLSPPIHREAGWTLYMAGRPDDAIREFDIAIRLDPEFAQAYTGRGNALVQKGDYDGGIASIIRGRQLAPLNENFRGWLAYSFARAGRKAEAGAMLTAMKDDLQHGRPASAYHIAAIHTALGEMTEAFAWLEQSCGKSPSMINVKAESAFDPLRSDPRFADVLKCAGFAPR
jgi:DNA-binding winged helix-turn-helix (wHTH) protein/TolB-like protein/Flp pilus assembly protein TadD